jgi:hypothetical protein
MVCNTDFFRTWSVEYLDETEYSGQMTISALGGGIVVLGTILKNAKLDGSYSSTDAKCPGADERQMVFTYLLATGHTGRLTLNLSTVNFGQPFIDGNYVDTGTGGDQGRVRLRPI